MQKHELFAFYNIQYCCIFLIVFFATCTEIKLSIISHDSHMQFEETEKLNMFLPLSRIFLILLRAESCRHSTT